MGRAAFIAVLLLAAVVSSGCAKSAHQSGRALLDHVIASELQRQIDESATFSTVAMSPETYVGKTVMFSGIALKAKRAKDRTEIEVLQLPADPGTLPTGDRSRSEGRFLAVREGFLDPATIEEGTPVTVIGEFQGTMSRPLDGSKYSYPIIKIEQLLDWNKTPERAYVGWFSPLFGGYYRPYSYMWGAPYGYYPMVTPMEHGDPTTRSCLTGRPVALHPPRHRPHRSHLSSADRTRLPAYFLM